MDRILAAALKAIPAINGQVYPLIADETATGAYVVYERVNTNRLNTLGGDTGCAIITYDIHAIAVKYADCIDLTDAARIACTGMTGAQSDGVTVQSVDIIGDKPQEYASDLSAYRATLQISVFVSNT